MIKRLTAIYEKLSEDDKIPEQWREKKIGSENWKQTNTK